MRSRLRRCLPVRALTCLLLGSAMSLSCAGAGSPPAASNGGGHAGPSAGAGFGGSQPLGLSGGGTGGERATSPTGGLADAGQAGRSVAGADAGPGEAGQAGAGNEAGFRGFVHPGLLIRADDLARAKGKLADKASPWFDSYQLLSADPESSATYKIGTPPSIIGRNSASAYASTRYVAEAEAVVAFQNALLFALTGDSAHAGEAVTVLNAYARTTLHFDQADPERDLEAAILGWLWVSAAELVRYNGYEGWSTADRQRFDDWIRNVVYDDSSYHPGGVLVTPLENGAGARGAFGLRTKMAIGIYLDDRAIFEQAVDYFFNGKGNGAPDYYINPTTGQTWEEGRDQGHAQGGLSRLIECAQMASTQGDSTLYSWKAGALQRAIEYIASYNLGNDVPYSPMQPYTTSYASVYPEISSAGRGSFATIYELPYAYFHGTLGMDLPETSLAIQHEGAENFSQQNDNPMFATLLYRR